MGDFPGKTIQALGAGTELESSFVLQVYYFWPVGMGTAFRPVFKNDVCDSSLGF